MPQADFSGVYNTPVPPERQAEYQKWYAALPKNLQNQHDYDIQGAFLNGNSPTLNDHLTDQFKKPNHSTFSDGSQYNGIDGYVGGKWTDAGYQPSQTNLQFKSQPELQKYFTDYEPKEKLLPPEPTPAPTGNNGQYRISDFSRYGQQQPAPQPPQPITPQTFLRYGQPKQQ
jgi:hypothetical protein